MVGLSQSLKQFFYSVTVLFSCLLSIQFVNASDGPNLSWSQLNQQQQTVLKPLAEEWDNLRPWQRAKMLSIAEDFPKMPADKQAVVQKRLINWSRMTPYEREQARKHHQQFKSLSPEKQAEIKKQWQAYEKLSDAEKEKLKSGAYPDDGLGTE